MIMEKKRKREAWIDKAPQTSNREDEQAGWKRLWGVLLPPKLKIFAWRLARSSIPTGEVRHHRHMATTAACVFCGAAIDTWRHSLLDCNMARAVWAISDQELYSSIVIDETPDAKLWLFELSRNLEPEIFARTLVIMWAVWWARRRAIHEEEFQAPLSTHAFVTRFMADVVDARIRNRQLKKAGGRILVPSICWTPPATGVAKIHADGGLSKDRQVGAAAAV